MDNTSGAGDIERYSFLVAFANDDLIDLQELRFIEKLALRDGVVDDEERAELRAIFARVDRARLDSETSAELARFCAQYGI